MQKPAGPALRREVGATSLALNAINLTVGSGIFVLPAIVAMNLGAAGFIAYLLCALLVILIMLCYAEVGSKITISGGSYAYVEKASLTRLSHQHTFLDGYQFIGRCRSH